MFSGQTFRNVLHVLRLAESYYLKYNEYMKTMYNEYIYMYAAMDAVRNNTNTTVQPTLVTALHTSPRYLSVVGSWRMWDRGVEMGGPDKSLSTERKTSSVREHAGRSAETCEQGFPPPFGSSPRLFPSLPRLLLKALLLYPPVRDEVPQVAVGLAELLQCLLSRR